MAGEWAQYDLSDILEHVADNRGRNPAAYSENGIPVIDNYLITSDWRIDLSKCKRCIDSETYNSFIRKHIKEDDVLITLVGNGYGQVAITPKEKCVIIQNTVGLRCNSENNNRYLYYLLKGNRDVLMNLNIGAAQPSIKVGNLLELPFEFPPLSEQKAIAHILGSLDDKIELNRRMNETLEGMAQALFKSWFVDFDPVIDNALEAGSPIPEEFAQRAEIRRKALEDGTANRDLSRHSQKATAEAAKSFPASFQETEEMGWIPEGWELRPFSECMNILGGGTPKRSEPEYWDGNIPWFSVKDAPAKGEAWIIDTDEKITELGISKSSAKIMRTGTSIISARGTVGKVGLCGQPMSMNQSCYGIQGKEPIGDTQTYFWLKHLVEQLQQKAHGSVFDTITTKTFDNVKVHVSDHHICTAYENIAGGLLVKARSALEESAMLTKLRDTLLPKLISGDLRIEDAEKMVGERI